jgi:hypothetical protein
MKKVYNQPIVTTDACIKGLISFMSATVPWNPYSGLPELAPKKQEAF